MCVASIFSLIFCFVAAPQDGPAKYKGMTAAQWGPQLLDADRETSERASEALTHIGAESLPWIVKGAASKIEHVRANAFVVLITDKIAWAKSEKNRKTLSPVIQAGLKDESAFVRSRAAWTVPAVMFPECIDALKAAYDVEKNANTKESMRGDLEQAKVNQSKK
jgi:hypothetical protein